MLFREVNRRHGPTSTTLFVAAWCCKRSRIGSPIQSTANGWHADRERFGPVERWTLHEARLAVPGSRISKFSSCMFVRVTLTLGALRPGRSVPCETRSRASEPAHLWPTSPKGLAEWGLIVRVDPGRHGCSRHLESSRRVPDPRPSYGAAIPSSSGRPTSRMPRGGAPGAAEH